MYSVLPFKLLLCRYLPEQLEQIVYLGIATRAAKKNLASRLAVDGSS